MCGGTYAEGIAAGRRSRASSSLRLCTSCSLLDNAEEEGSGHASLLKGRETDRAKSGAAVFPCYCLPAILLGRPSIGTVHGKQVLDKPPVVICDMVRLTPPAAPSVPVLGSLPFIGLGKAVGVGPPPHVRMAQLAERYGDVMELRMGRAPWVVLSSPAAVHEAFVLKGDAFSGRPMVPSMGISSGGGQGFAQPTLSPELSKLRRTAFASLFDAKQVARSQLQLEDEASKLAEHLLARTASGGSAELRPALRHCVTNCVLRYAFSARVPYPAEGGATEPSPRSPQPPQLVDQYAELVEVVGQIWLVLTATSTTMTDLLATPGLATDAAYAPLRALVARRDALLRALVAQRRREVRAAAAPPRDMLDVLLAAQLTDAEVL